MKIQKKLYMMVMMKMMILLSLAWWWWWCWSFDDCVSQEELDDDYGGGDDGDDDDVMTVLGSLFPKSTSRLMFVFCLRLLLLSFEGIIKHDNSVLFIMLLFFYFLCIQMQFFPHLFIFAFTTLYYLTNSLGCCWWWRWCCYCINTVGLCVCESKCPLYFCTENKI